MADIKRLYHVTFKHERGTYVDVFAAHDMAGALRQAQAHADDQDVRVHIVRDLEELDLYPEDINICRHYENA